MIKLEIPEQEMYDEERNLFYTVRAQTLCLEHSLVSISKWESKWCKPFLHTKKLTDEEIVDYIHCMTITQNVDPNVYSAIPQSEIDKLTAYIDAPMTATTFFNFEDNKPNQERVTSELIYYWMIKLNIPFECQKWHLNRLLTLIRVCSIKEAPPKKMSVSEIQARNRAINEARKLKYKTKG